MEKQEKPGSSSTAGNVRTAGRSVESAGKGDHAAALGKARGNWALQAKNDPGEDPDFLNYSKAFSGKKGNSDKAQSHIVFNFHRINKYTNT